MASVTPARSKTILCHGFFSKKKLTGYKFESELVIDKTLMEKAAKDNADSQPGSWISQEKTTDERLKSLTACIIDLRYRLQSLERTRYAVIETAKTEAVYDSTNGTVSDS